MYFLHQNYYIYFTSNCQWILYFFIINLYLIKNIIKNPKIVDIAAAYKPIVFIKIKSTIRNVPNS